MSEPSAVVSEDLTPLRFTCTAVAAAAPSAVWAVWTDVPGWSGWDTELRSARLEGAFEVGSAGVLQPLTGGASRFVLTVVEPGSHYAYAVSLPFGRLVVERRLAPTEGGTRLTHDVRFEGLSGGFFARVLGPRFRAALPAVVDNVKRAAEARGEGTGA